MRPLLMMILAGLAVPSPALPADAPQLIPTRDVAVTYRTDQGGQVVEQRMRWSAAARRMRVDAPTPGVFVIIDYAEHRMEVVEDAHRSFAEMDAPATLPGIGAATSGRYQRHGETAVSRIPCTEWTGRDADGREIAICVTADGVLLSERMGGRVLATASEVSYATQDAALFHVPAGYSRKERP